VQPLPIKEDAVVDLDRGDLVVKCPDVASAAV
jgi:hypothetical protein